MFLIVNVISLSVMSDDLVILLIVVTSAKSMKPLSHLERQFLVKAVTSVLGSVKTELIILVPSSESFCFFSIELALEAANFFISSYLL